MSSTRSGNRAYIHTEPSDWSSAGFSDHLRAAASSRRGGASAAEPDDPRRDTPVRGPLGRIAFIIGGTVLVLVGIPLLILPGPGLALIAAGAALVATGLGLRRTDRDTSAGRS